MVHRIDRFTSGLCSLRKPSLIEVHSFDSFLSHSPLRQYLVIVRGNFSVKEGTLVHYFLEFFERLFLKGNPPISSLFLLVGHTGLE